MTKPTQLVLWIRCWCAMLLLSSVAITSVHAQERAARKAARSNPAVATDGATLIHGNYCGAGNRPGKPPIDALDLACMNHDACSPTGGVPTCECNARLRDEAAAVAQDSRQAPELRSLASLTSAAATVMICNPMKTDAEASPAVVPPVAAPPAAASAAVSAPAPLPPAALPPAALPPPAVPSAVVSAAPAAAPMAAPPAVAAPLSIVPESVAPVTSDAPAAPEETPAASAPASAEPRTRSLP